MPSGNHCPFSQTLLDGPSSSKPLSQAYVATDPGPKVSSENMTLEWAGDPGNRHPSPQTPGNKSPIKFYDKITTYGQSKHKFVQKSSKILIRCL